MIKTSDDFLNELYLSFEYFGAGPGCGGRAGSGFLYRFDKWNFCLTLA